MEVLIQNPGEVIRPSISSVQIIKILTELYGLNPLEMAELISYDDRNVHIKHSTAQLNSSITEIWSYGYNLKILNSLESENPNLIECGKSGKENIVRLLTFIPGQVLASSEYTIHLFNNAGNYLSELHRVMKNFHHPEFDSRQSLWSMPSFPHLTKFLYAVENQAHVDLVREILREFQEKVETRYNELPKGLIHGDFNENNILIEMPADGEVHVTGILDFADVQFSCYAFDIAIGIMYLMLESNDVDVTHVGGHFLAGYCTQRTLDESEWEVQKICVAARFCVSLVMGLYTHSIDSKNDYALLTNKKGWKILERFWAVPEQKLLDLWKNIQTATKL
uniref:Hydroxylysine kinase n=1 Tax=Strigamia maritima TaxID=126957 RepID=T1JMJ4_STRMM